MKTQTWIRPFKLFTEKDFDALPGAWYGTAPFHAAIDPKCTVAALAYCRRHRIVVIETEVIDGNADPALVLRFATSPQVVEVQS